MRIIVVGAGIVGSAIAYEAARAGAEVTLVDRGPVAEQGASRFGFGALSWSSATTLSTGAFARRGFARYRELLRELGPDYGFRPNTALDLVRDEAGMEQAAAHVARLRDQGHPARLVGREELQSLEPALDLGGWAGAELFEQGHLDLQRCARAWVDAARAGGRCTFIEGVEVQRLLGNGSRLETSGGVHAADLVFLAAGAWLRPLLARDGVTLPVFYSRAEFLYSALVPPLLRHQVTWGASLREDGESASIAGPLLDAWRRHDDVELVPPAIEHALIQYPDGHLRIGQLTRFSPAIRASAEPATRDLLLASTRRLLPDVDRLPDLRLGARPVTFTPDHLPIVGPVPGFPRAIAVITSTSPSIMAPALGEALAAYATTGTWDPALDEWRPEREALRR